MLASWISSIMNNVMASSPWNNSLIIGHVKGMDGWHGRLTWKPKGTMSAWRRRISSWSLVMATMSSRNLASTPVLSAVMVSAAAPSCAHSVYCESTRSTVASLNDWLPMKTMFSPGVRVSLGSSIAKLWLKWMSTAPYLMWKSLFAG